jgi:alkanesulfonate monooxygenase SsuD/methylene tetrahydromethanopterin reductase-like flavin-dependent oxidoreductase (luciferase family)
VGRLGFPIFLSMRGMDVDDLKTNLRDYHKAWREAGHPGEAGDISVRFPMYIAPTDDEAVEDPKETIEAYFQRMRRIFEEGWGRTGSEYWERRQRRIEQLEKLTYEEILETKVIFGSPERVIDRLFQFKDMLGLTGFTAELNPGGLLPPEAVHRSLKLLTEEVMPAFK